MIAVTTAETRGVWPRMPMSRLLMRRRMTFRELQSQKYIAYALSPIPLPFGAVETAAGISTS